MDAIIEQMQKMVGYVPVGTRDLLKILAHPDMILLTRQYLDDVELGLINDSEDKI